MLKNKEGITLVTLIITIIILLILAGVTIAQLTENGLFEKARKAGKKTENAQIKEERILAGYENKIGQYIEGSREEIIVDKDEYEKLVDTVYTLEESLKNSNQKTTELNEEITTLKEDNKKLSNDIAQLKVNNTVKNSTFSVNSGLINGSKCYLSKLGNIVSIEINGDTGSNIEANKIVILAKNLPKVANTDIQELAITLDGTTGYARAWIDNYGQLCVYQSINNYTGNVFIGGTYIAND